MTVEDEYDAHNDPDPDGQLTSAPEPSMITDKAIIKKPSKWKTKVHNAFIRFRQKASDITAEYPNALGYAKTAADTLVNLKYYDTPWAVAKGAFSFLSDLSSDHFYDITSLCNPNDGWRYLSSRSRSNIGFLFRDVVENLPCHKIKFRNNTTAECYNFHGHQIFYAQGVSSVWWLYFNSQQIPTDKFLKLLVAEKFKVINTKFLFVKEASVNGSNQLTVLPVDPPIRTSKRATEIKEMLTEFLDAGYNRSLFLYGQPGTGKTSLAYAILDALGFRTIVFSASNAMVSFELVRDLCEMFEIQAVIIDDFDAFSNTHKNLDVLEYFNREARVLIGVANSLANFHPAVMRPGRFDKEIAIEALDIECVQEILGEDLSERYYDKVREFPVAYINELKKSSLFLDKEECDAYVEALVERVEKAKARMDLLKGFNSLL